MPQAPEVVKSNKANERVDQYAFAIVVWELLARKGLLFMRQVRLANGARTDVTPQMWAEQAIKGARPRVEEAWPKPLCDVMLRCWHGDPLKRPRFQEVLDMLQPLQQPALWTDPTTAPPPAPKASRISTMSRISTASRASGRVSAASRTSAASSAGSGAPEGRASTGGAPAGGEPAAAAAQPGCACVLQ